MVAAKRREIVWERKRRRGATKPRSRSVEKGGDGAKMKEGGQVAERKRGRFLGWSVASRAGGYLRVVG